MPGHEKYSWPFCGAQGLNGAFTEETELTLAHRHPSSWQLHLGRSDVIQHLAATCASAGAGTSTVNDVAGSATGLCASQIGTAPVALCFELSCSRPQHNYARSSITTPEVPEAAAAYYRSLVLLPPCSARYATLW